MSLGQVIRIIEGIVTIYCGVVLAVRPCYMRWDNKVVKCIFGILILLGMGIEVLNTFYAKFSAEETLVLATYFFVVLMIFYRVYFWKLFAQNFIYWFTILLFRYLIIYICSYTQNITFFKYNESSQGIPWHWLHILSMIVAMGVAIWLLQKRKDKSMILCKSNREYIWLSLVVIGEELINKVLFSNKKTMMVVQDVNLFLMFLVFWLAFSLILIIAISKAYMGVVHQERISQLNLSMLQKQYTLFQEIYAEKRRQIHDSVQFDIMLMGYLKEGKTEKTIQCLEEKLKQYSFKQKNRYTGIDVIDLMLTYKINEAGQYNINVKLDIDVFFCPVNETNMCIILGNLLDNAIDAVQELKNEQRWIRIKMINPNSIFILEISNPYVGKRNKVEGHYVTTKLDKTMHGLGLDSVERIVNKVDGVMDIIDKDSIFTVVVTLFGKRRRNNDNRGHQ